MPGTCVTYCSAVTHIPSQPTTEALGFSDNVFGEECLVASCRQCMSPHKYVDLIASPDPNCLSRMLKAVMKNSISRIGGSLLQLQYKPSQDITVTTCRVEGERTFWIEAKANILQCPGTTCKTKTTAMKTKSFCEEVSWSPS